MFQSRLRNVYRCSVGGGIPCCYGTLKVHYCIYKSPLIVSTINPILIASSFVKLVTVITNPSLGYWTIASFWCAVHSKPIRSHRRTKSGTGRTASDRRAADWSVDMKPLPRDEIDRAASVLGRTRPYSNRSNAGAGEEREQFVFKRQLVHKKGVCKMYPPNVWMNQNTAVSIVIRLRSG